VHGVDEHGKVVLRKTVRRSKLLELFVQLPACVVGMEACGGAQYWARELRQLGHEPRIMAAEFVAPYRQGGKNDANDAAAICEAVARPKMRSWQSNRWSSRRYWRCIASPGWSKSVPRLTPAQPAHRVWVSRQRGLDRLRRALPDSEDGGNGIPGIGARYLADATGITRTRCSHRCL
jgi:transposase